MNLADQRRHFFVQRIGQKPAEIFFRKRGVGIGHLHIKGQVRRDTGVVQLEVMDGQIVSAGGKNSLSCPHQVIPERIIHSHGVSMHDKLNPKIVHGFMFYGISDGMHIME